MWTNLPVDLVIVRHGESEGNLYRELKDDGKRERLHGRDTHDYRLTDLGRNQAARAGEIVKSRIGTFDRMYCSAYTRAIETAGHMNLPDSRFEIEPLIREIEMGKVKGIKDPTQEYKTMMKECLGKWWFRNAGGENFADLCLRLRLFLNHLREECRGMRVLLVAHGHVMRAFQVLLEDVKPYDFEEVLQRKLPNCGIRWYTRRDANNAIQAELQSLIEIVMKEPKSLVRHDAEFDESETKVTRKFMSASELREAAQKVPQLLNNSDLPADASPHSPLDSSCSTLDAKLSLERARSGDSCFLERSISPENIKRIDSLVSMQQAAKIGELTESDLEKLLVRLGACSEDGARELIEAARSESGAGDYKSFVSWLFHSL